MTFFSQPHNDAVCHCKCGIKYMVSLWYLESKALTINNNRTAGYVHFSSHESSLISHKWTQAHKLHFPHVCLVHMLADTHIHYILRFTFTVCCAFWIYWLKLNFLFEWKMTPQSLWRHYTIEKCVWCPIFSSYFPLPLDNGNTGCRVNGSHFKNSWSLCII